MHDLNYTYLHCNYCTKNYIRQRECLVVMKLLHFLINLRNLGGLDSMNAYFNYHSNCIHRPYSN